MNKQYHIYAEMPKIPLGTEVNVSFEFIAMCPVPKPNKPYGGVISIAYTPKVEEGTASVRWLRLLEWDSFAEWIKDLKHSVISAEEMAHTVICKFIGEIDPEKATLCMRISTPFHLPAEINLTYKARR